MVCRLATSSSSRTPVHSTSSARNCPSVSSSCGQPSSAATFSTASGTGSAAWAARTLATTTSSASRVRGTGSRWPASRPPARTKATCSLTSGAPTASAHRASRSSRRGSGGSALPSETVTPCGSTGTPRARSSQLGDQDFCQFLTETIRLAEGDGSWADAFARTLGRAGVPMPPAPEPEPCPD